MKDLNSTYDYIVIGAGSGGLVTAIGLAKIGKQVLLVSENVGGDCTYFGCVPSKALLKQADKYYKSKDPNIKENTFKYVAEKINEIAKEDEELINIENLTHIKARAKFISKDEIEIKTTEKGESKVIKFNKNCIIATGSSARELKDKRIPKDKILNNENVFSLKQVPKSLTIIGGGPIGLEMATAFAKLGSKVDLYERGEIMRFTPRNLVKEVKNSLESLGVKINENTDINKIDLPKSDYYFIAIGRTPNLNINLEAAGIEYDKYGIKVNKNLKTTNKKVFAIGDVTPFPKFTHLAENHGRFVVMKIATKFSQRVEPALPWVIFTDPTASSVGKTIEDEFTKLYKIDFSKGNRGIIDQEKSLLANIYVHKLNGRIQGASLVGKFAETGINFFTLAVQKKLRVWQLSNFIIPYPTYFSGMNQIVALWLADLTKDGKSLVGKLIKKNLAKIITAIFWFTAVTISTIYLSRPDVTIQMLAEDLVGIISEPITGPAIFLILYFLRPLISFSAAVLTILAASVYGLIPGIILTVIGSNASALLGYLLGKTVFANSSESNSSKSLESGFKSALQNNPFEATLTARLTFLPYDFVSYVAGGLKLKISPFLVGSLLGALPGTIALSLFGASLENLEDLDEFELQPEFLVGGFVILFASLGLSKLIKSRKKNKTK